jgi:xylose isomerase
LTQKAGYNRWKGHDMQPRAYDNAENAIDRVVRSILSWEACEHAAKNLDMDELLICLGDRKVAKAQDMMADSVQTAQKCFKEMYN